VSELWTYTSSFDQVRFSMVHRSPDAPVVRVAAERPEPVAAARAKPVAVKAKPAAAKTKPAATLRPSDKLKVAPSKVEGRQAQGRPEQSRGTKPKPVATAKAKPAKKPAAKPKAKPTPAARKSVTKGRR